MQLLRRTLRIAMISTAMLLLFVSHASAESLGIGTINSDGLNLRAEPSTDSVIYSVASVSTHAVVLEDTGTGWYKVDFNAVEGYMASQYVDLSTSIEVDLGYGLVKTPEATLNVRSGPGTGYERVGVLYDTAVVDLLGMENGWFKVRYEKTGLEGYASSDYVVLCRDSSGNRGDDPVAVGSGSSTSYTTRAAIEYASSTSSSPLGQQIVAYAKQFLGTPYVWGGNGPNSFDCSGFTKYVYSHFGYSLNRTASAQLNNGYSVSRSNLQPGDLIFFYNGKVSTPVSHVGIYIGDGQFIHASTNSYAVQINSLYSSAYDRMYVYARRII